MSFGLTGPCSLRTATRRVGMSVLALLAVGGLLLASCSRGEPPAAGHPQSAAATPHRFSILESLEQPEGYALLRIRDSELGQLSGGGVVRMPLYGRCGELSAVESMLNVVAASTSESEIGTISRVACRGDGFELITVNSLPCGCDFGKLLQVAQERGEFRVARITDWKDKAPEIPTPGDVP